MARYLCIINPVSGRGRGASVADVVEHLAAEYGHSVRILLTQHAGHAFNILRQGQGDWADALISVGGDGTFNEVLNGRGDTPQPIGVVPLGTGNVLAKELGVPKRHADAVRVSMDWNLHTMDIAALDNGKRFACMLGAGIEGRILQLLEESRSGGTMHMAQYLPIGLKALRDANKAKISVSVDGKRVIDGVGYALCANTHSFGGPIEMVSRAKSNDGLLDLLTLSGDLRLSYPTAIISALTRTVHSHPAARLFRGRWFRFDAETNTVPYQMDGEFAGTLPVEGRVIEGGLATFVPKR